MTIFSANELCKTHLCEARDCPEDAMLGSPICERHDRLHKQGKRVTLHETHEPPDPTLKCGACGKWKPDRFFSISKKAVGGPVKDRRGRHVRCQECVANARFTNHVEVGHTVGVSPPAQGQRQERA